jgi:hypothetical protein
VYNPNALDYRENEDMKDAWQIHLKKQFDNAVLDANVSAEQRELNIKQALRNATRNNVAIVLLEDGSEIQIRDITSKCTETVSIGDVFK